jgi:para-nitrobenzyl esterase
VYAWTPDDYQVSKVMQEYFANFIKTGNPNGRGLPKWPKFDHGQRLIIDVNTRAENDKVRARYEFLDQFYIRK